MIGYSSRSLIDAERPYDKTNLEWLAGVWGVLLLRANFDGTRFTIGTYQEILRCILDLHIVPPSSPNEA